MTLWNANHIILLYSNKGFPSFSKWSKSAEILMFCPAPDILTLALPRPDPPRRFWIFLFPAPPRPERFWPLPRPAGKKPCPVHPCYITIPSSDQWCTTIENHCIVTNGCLTPKPSENHWSQWLPSTIPFNGDGNFENHWKFAMVAKKCAKNPKTQQH